MATDNPFNIDRQLKRITESALAHTSGNRTDAAQLMGISVRTLRNWINKYHLARDYPPQMRKRRK